MEIVAISDTHSMHHQVKIPKSDVFIYAGDLCGRSVPGEIPFFINWLKEVPCEHKIIVAGNHDIPLEMRDRWSLQDIKDMFQEAGAHYLQDESVEINGFTFYGSPYTPIFFNWAFMEYEDQLENRWRNIPEKTDVLITHGPPRGILDKNKKGVSCGSLALFKAIKRNSKIRYHIFGHIHEGYGTAYMNGVHYYNVSVCTRNYNPINPPTLFEIAEWDIV